MFSLLYENIVAALCVLPVTRIVQTWRGNEKVGAHLNAALTKDGRGLINFGLCSAMRENVFACVCTSLARSLSLSMLTSSRGRTRQKSFHHLHVDTTLRARRFLCRQLTAICCTWTHTHRVKIWELKLQSASIFSVTLWSATLALSICWAFD